VGEETPDYREKSSPIPAPTGGKIRRVEFDDDAAGEVAVALGGTAGTAPFRLPSGAVYQVVVPGKDERPAVMLTLWPAIRRVDAIATGVTVVFTDIAAIDIVGEIEVQFRRANREYFIVARGGKVIVRA
jgi:hypothetical protein